MRILRPESQNDEMERESERRLRYDEDAFDQGNGAKGRDNSRWRRTVEQALVKMTTEVAALREQIETGREFQQRKRRRPTQWIIWFWWVSTLR